MKWFNIYFCLLTFLSTFNFLESQNKIMPPSTGAEPSAIPSRPEGLQIGTPKMPGVPKAPEAMGEPKSETGMPQTSSSEPSRPEGPPIGPPKMPGVPKAPEAIGEPKSETGMPQTSSSEPSRPEGPPIGPPKMPGVPKAPEAMGVSPSMPKPPAEVVDPKIQEIVPKGLDTTDVGDQGNWLMKRVWYEQSEEAFGKLLSELDSIIQLQIKLFKSVTESEKKTAGVFKKNSLEIDDIERMLGYLIGKAKDKPDEKEADAVREARELLAETLPVLEDLKKDIKKYRDLESSLSSVVNQIISQVNRAREYQKDGWNEFKEVGNTLNDEKAKKLYYKLEGYKETLEKINNYLASSLKSFTDKISSQTLQAANKVVDSKHKLNEKHFFLEKVVDTLKNAAKLLEEEEKKEDARKAAAVKAKRKKQQESKGWLTSIIDWFTSWF